MSLTDTARAAATERLRFSEFTDEDIDDAIAGNGPNVSKGNPLFSEELTSAHRQVIATGDEDLVEAFEDTTRALLKSGRHQGSAANFGFDERNSFGIGVQKALHSGDTTILDRMADKNGYCSPQDDTVNATIKSFRRSLKTYARDESMTLTSTYNPQEATKPKGPANQKA